MCFEKLTGSMSDPGDSPRLAHAGTGRKGELLRVDMTREQKLLKAIGIRPNETSKKLLTAIRSSDLLESACNSDEERKDFPGFFVKDTTGSGKKVMKPLTIKTGGRFGIKQYPPCEVALVGHGADG